MTLPDSAYYNFTPDLRICRILTGMWQLSGGHGPVDREAATRALGDYLDWGFTTFDLADHYGPAEDVVGEFRRRIIAQRGAQALAGMQAFTKWVPPPTRFDARAVANAIAISRRRMDTATLDLLQFHWWDYANSAYLDTLEELARLRDAGQIRHLALTNFDTAHVQTIVERGIRIVSNQVQFSLVDLRPLQKMIPYCREHSITLLTYGTVCGGLLSERFLGQPEPRRAALNTSSLQKYKQMTDVWGGWELFQELLQTLKGIADKHGVSITNVAVRYILDQPAVAGVIVGARLGQSDNRVDNACVFNFTLDANDLARIHGITSRSRDLMAAIGDCGDEYR